MVEVTVTYIRGDTYVENSYRPKEKDYTDADRALVKQGNPPKTRMAHGLVGELWVHGLCFETIERMDGYMNMAGDRKYPFSSMYYMSHYGSWVINPWLGKEQEKTKVNILFHPAQRPSEVEGCVGVGFFAGGLLTDGASALFALCRQIGGDPSNIDIKPTFTLEVQGQMKALSACTKAPGA